MKPVDVSAVANIIAEVAAAEIMPRFRKLQDGDIEMKGVNDPVTVADRAAEQALTERFAAAFPGSVVVGEESFAADPQILSRFGGEHDVWVIDPIDGTRNFISGTPEFGVMVALVRRRQTVAAWIHDPNSGDTLSAEQGSGVRMRGFKMRLAGHDPAFPPRGIIGSRLKKMLSKSEHADLLGRLPQLATGSAAAFDYGRMFTGEGVFADSQDPRVSYLLYRQSKPWDHVPGLFMLAEANGYAADLKGKPYDMERGMNGLMVAPDQAAWNGLHKELKPLIDPFLMP